MKSIFQTFFKFFTRKKNQQRHNEGAALDRSQKTSAKSLLSTVRIKLPVNSLLNEKVVFYYEKTPAPLVRQTLEQRYQQISKTLQNKGLHLLYLPALCGKFESWSEANGNHPALPARPDLFIHGTNMNPKEMENWLSEIDTEGLTTFISAQLQFPELETPCLLHCIDFTGRGHTKETLLYSYVPLETTDSKLLNLQLDEYVRTISLPTPSIQYSAGNRSTSKRIDFSVEYLEEAEKTYDADEAFFEEETFISPELRLKIADVKNQAEDGKALETLLYIVKQFSEVNPELCRQICKQLASAANSMEIKTSRLHIDAMHKIYLTDYRNIEIEMTALPKTLFIFLLKHPEGMMFKELYKHKWELMHIYGQVGNRSDIEQISKSINDLTNAQSNSVNEKCSRIKEAFLSKLDASLATPYLVSGGRSRSKLIKIDRSLVTMHHRYQAPKF